ncbi:V-type H+-transporting ATPase subunit H [Fistulifera solaris]|uniref:V-type H+-transporting ATPase subunit H n=1 Tax=Fistulifera solaris TaxID=1519565 RepID=A0A1Z5KS71_FISSO|nr:V-type H+-transporting ATPase subunit H [Fistulifera solaris]|eukprot:GAX28841.1 V-type H+-transporting ATPase subunit H [Fistulifera solaris]
MEMTDTTIPSEAVASAAFATLKSPVAPAFAHIQWDSLGTLQLTAQETALLRMAETNPMDYTLSDSRDASMYARVLLKLVAESSAAGAGMGEVSKLSPAGVTEQEALETLAVDPLGVVCHYALTKLLDILQTLKVGVKGVSIATVFYVGKDGILVEQWKALLRILDKPGKGDAFAQKVAALCLAQMLVTACPSQRHRSVDGKARPIQYASAVEPLEAITAWVISQLKNATGPLVGSCSPALKVLVDAHETRVLFCKSGGIKYMARQLRIGNKSPLDKKKMASVQQLYEIAFCMWILTYELNHSSAIRHDFAKDSLAVSALVDLIAVAPREKVVRVALASLRNLALCTVDENEPAPANGAPKMDGKFFLSEMIACGLIKAVDHLRDRQFTDPDLAEDIQLLHKLLHENYKEMSRWEVYKNEVESGHLQWGSCHTEAFFKENARMMEGSDGDFRLLKVLIALLSNRDEEVAAIACFDIGEFVRHYPNGRAIVKRLGAKDLVMTLIEHENAELQRHALQCVSKIMVNNWEYVK